MLGAGINVLFLLGSDGRGTHSDINRATCEDVPQPNKVYGGRVVLLRRVAELCHFKCHSEPAIL